MTYIEKFDESTNHLLQKHDVEIRQKGDWAKWWHYIVPIFFFIVGIFSSDTKRWFYENVINVLYTTIYVPDLESFKKNPERSEATIRHELVHINDWKSHSIWFPISYVFSRKMRAFWEYRGYTQNLINSYESNGEVSVVKMMRIADIFKSIKYFWMDTSPFPVLMAIRDKIENEEITGFNDNEILNNTIKEHRT